MTIQIFKGVQNQELVLKADYDKAASFESSLDEALRREKYLERELIRKQADYDKLATENMVWLGVENYARLNQNIYKPCSISSERLINGDRCISC